MIRHVNKIGIVLGVLLAFHHFRHGSDTSRGEWKSAVFPSGRRRGQVAEQWYRLRGIFESLGRR